MLKRSQISRRQPRRVVVTGVGMVTPLGHCVSSSWKNLIDSNRQAGAAMTTLDNISPSIFFPKHLHQPSQQKQQGGGEEGEEDQKRRKAILDSLPAKVVAPVPETDEIMMNTKQQQEQVVVDSSKKKTSLFASTSRSTRHQLFAEHAAKEALIQSGLISSSSSFSSSFYKTHKRGVNVGVGMNSLHDISEVSNNLYSSSSSPKLNRIEPFFVPKILCNTVAGSLSMQYHLRGPNHCTSTACATGAHCIGDAFRWIQRGEANMVLCGATEAAINPVGLVGFARMKALSTKFNETPHAASRPFDEDRCGFVMGEGAGMLVLEELEGALKRGVKKEDILCEIVGYGMSGDAHHVSSPHPKGIGAALAMFNCLSDARKNNNNNSSSSLFSEFASQVVHLNAHATGTPMGDEIELAAATKILRGHLGDLIDENQNKKNQEEEEDIVEIIEREEKEESSSSNSSSSSSSSSPLIISSVKGHIGHLLGASGSVEAIFAIQSLINHIAPGTANLDNPVAHDEKKVILSSKPVSFFNNSQPAGPMVMSTSFGFGGTNAAVLFRKLV